MRCYLIPFVMGVFSFPGGLYSTKLNFVRNNDEAGFLRVCPSMCPIPVNMKYSNT